MRYIRCQKGHWSFLWEAETGFVRELRYGGERLAVALYCAVRGADWSTYPVQIFDVEWGETWCRWRSQAVGAPFSWLTEARLEEDGFRFYIDGVASQTFSTCRTGICVLHPLSVCGYEVSVRHVDGSTERSAFPKLVAPHQPFMEMAGMRYRTPAGLEVDFALSGEVFETEDQRNWSDASFKTYCHRLGDAKPYTIASGQRVWQEVRIACLGEPVQPAAPPSTVLAHMPLISANLDVSAQAQVRACQQLGLTRVTVGSVSQVEAVTGVATDLVLRVEQIGSLQPVSPPTETGSILWLISDRWSPEVESLVRYASQQWKPLGWELGYGSSANFAELNRSRPSQGMFDWIATAASPQVHTFDAWSILQNAESFADIGATMRAFGGSAALGVMPLRFGSRFTGEDPRADSVLSAAYLLRAFVYLALGGFRVVSVGQVSQLLRADSVVGSLLRDLLSFGVHTIRQEQEGGIERLELVGAGGTLRYLVNPSPEERNGLSPFTYKKEE